MRKSREEIKAQRNDWVSGMSGLTRKESEYTTEFEQLLQRLGLTEENCVGHSEVIAFCKAKCNSRYISERVLARLHVRTIYDEGDTAPFSFVEGTVIPEPLPFQEVDDEQTPQENAA